MKRPAGPVHSSRSIGGDHAITLSVSDLRSSRGQIDRPENRCVESRGSRDRPRHRHDRLSRTRRADERGRYGAGPLRRAPRHDEKRPDAWTKRAIWTTGTSYTSDLRHTDYGP